MHKTMRARRLALRPWIFAIVATLGVAAASAQVAGRVPDWDSVQGNAQHTGHVPLTLQPTKARTVWEWRSPRAGDGVTPFVNPVTVVGGRIAVSDDDYFSPQSLYLLNEADGSVLWTHAFAADTPGLNPPTLKGDHVYVATSGHEATRMHAFDAATGALVWQTAFPGQWPHFLAPTVDGSQVLSAGGYYGGVYGFRRQNGAEVGSNTTLPFVDLFTPAVDDTRMFVYTTDRLNIIDRRSFAVTVISDPAPSSTCCGSYLGAPMLSLARQRVLAFSGDSFSGRASSSTGGFYARAIVSFDLARQVLEWRSEDLFITQPALAHGLVFAGSNTPLRLAALHEADGSLAWGWAPADGATQFCRNVVATDSHVFVSTDRAVHAIDLATRQSVWSIPVAGELALSARGTLLINEGCRESTGRLVAVKLPKR